jgi:hypothetical protein
LNDPANVIIAFLELLEAEGRDLKGAMEDLIAGRGTTLRRSAMRLAGSLGLILGAVVLLLAALAMVLWGLYLYLSASMEPPRAALLTSAAALLMALVLTVVARWLSR